MYLSEGISDMRMRQGLGYGESDRKAYRFIKRGAGCESKGKECQAPYHREKEVKQNDAGRDMV